ncbi:MAG: hypothetical protein H6627_09760 [Calditrichae bacterium]|nr:hypothetical protein [Calditrichota bacterium]MCB9058841.1 hypothetical protein [Calditrichia bacterium]
MQEEILIPITLFIAVAIVLYNFLKSRHAERMAIIDKGLNEEQLSYLLRTKKAPASNEWSIKLGAILIGVGLAILLGTMAPYDMRDAVITGLIFLFPGIGLLLVYIFAGKKSEE